MSSVIGWTMIAASTPSKWPWSRTGILPPAFGTRRFLGRGAEDDDRARGARPLPERERAMPRRSPSVAMMLWPQPWPTSASASYSAMMAMVGPSGLPPGSVAWKAVRSPAMPRSTVRAELLQHLGQLARTPGTPAGRVRGCRPSSRYRRSTALRSGQLRVARVLSVRIGLPFLLRSPRRAFASHAGSSIAAGRPENRAPVGAHLASRRRRWARRRGRLAACGSSRDADHPEGERKFAPTGGRFSGVRDRSQSGSMLRLVTPPRPRQPPPPRAYA